MSLPLARHTFRRCFTFKRFGLPITFVADAETVTQPIERFPSRIPDIMLKRFTVKGVHGHMPCLTGNPSITRFFDLYGH